MAKNSEDRTQPVTFTIPVSLYNEAVKHASGNKSRRLTSLVRLGLFAERGGARTGDERAQAIQERLGQLRDAVMRLPLLSPLITRAAKLLYEVTQLKGELEVALAEIHDAQLALLELCGAPLPAGARGLHPEASIAPTAPGAPSASEQEASPIAPSPAAPSEAFNEDPFAVYGDRGRLGKVRQVLGEDGKPRWEPVEIDKTPPPQEMERAPLAVTSAKDLI